jgi:hypothetical protein
MNFVFGILWENYLAVDYDIIQMPVPVAARPKSYVCGRLPAEILGLNPTGGMDVCL